MIFRTALSIASDHSRVAVVHIVREYGRALSILREMRPERFIVHGFTGSLETAREIISLGGIISLSPRAERTSAFDELLKLPFATETDMETGEEEMRELMAWNGRLSELTGIDIGARSERMMKEILA